MRVFEKYAVKVGGGYNHRYNLSDGILLKDNHIGAAGGVKQAIMMAKEYAPFVRKIEVEVENLDMLKEGIGLRAYGQKDPLIEYKKEAYDLFNKMMFEIQSTTIKYLFRAKFGIQFVSEDGVEVLEN